MKKRLCGIFALMLSFTAALSAESSNHVDVFFMHDVHSFLDETAKAKTIIDEHKKINPDTLVLDAGDFSMGTLYQTVFSSRASELRILGKVGVEATTMGNHEFDFGSKALADMFVTARNSGEKVPQFVLCNADWSNPNGYTKEVKAGLDVYGTSDYIMLDKGGVKVAVLGVFGKDALFCAPTCEINFLDQVESVRKTVEYIKANEKPDLIVCLSHSGTSRNPSSSEDEILAKAVPDLDLIISGHTHTVLDAPIIHGSTVIASCGAYSAYLGSLSLEKNDDGRWSLSGYRLIPLRESGASPDPEIVSMLRGFAEDVDREYLSIFGYKSSQILATTERAVDEDTELGYLLGECMYSSVKKAGVPVDFVVIPSGLKRETFKSGSITVSDAFKSYSLGIGPDGITGYPLVKAWVTGKELKNICEIDCSVSGLYSTARLFLTGLSYEYNPARMILDRVTKVYIDREDGSRIEADPDEKYCIVSDIYTANMLGGILNMTKGLITVQPTDDDGNIIKDYTPTIIHNSDGTELKGWIAIAHGLAEKGTIESYADRLDERRLAVKSYSPVALFAHPSKTGRVVRLIVLTLVAVIVLIVLLVKKIKKARKARKALHAEV